MQQDCLDPLNSQRNQNSNIKLRKPSIQANNYILEDSSGDQSQRSSTESHNNSKILQKIREKQQHISQQQKTSIPTSNSVIKNLNNEPIQAKCFTKNDQIQQIEQQKQEKQNADLALLISGLSEQLKTMNMKFDNFQKTVDSKFDQVLHQNQSLEQKVIKIEHKFRKLKDKMIKKDSVARSGSKRRGHSGHRHEKENNAEGNQVLASPSHHNNQKMLNQKPSSNQVYSYQVPNAISSTYQPYQSRHAPSVQYQNGAANGSNVINQLLVEQTVAQQNLRQPSILHQNSDKPQIQNQVPSNSTTNNSTAQNSSQNTMRSLGHKTSIPGNSGSSYSIDQNPMHNQFSNNHDTVKNIAVHSGNNSQKLDSQFSSLTTVKQGSTISNNNYVPNTTTTHIQPPNLIHSKYQYQQQYCSLRYIFKFKIIKPKYLYQINFLKFQVFLQQPSSQNSSQQQSSNQQDEYIQKIAKSYEQTKTLLNTINHHN